MDLEKEEKKCKLQDHLQQWESTRIQDPEATSKIPLYQDQLIPSPENLMKKINKKLKDFKNKWFLEFLLRDFDLF